MKMRLLFLIAVLTLALAGVVQGSDDLPDKSPITAGKYRSFLAAVAEFQDAHSLYQPDMEDQIISTQEGDQKKYRVVEGQEEELMGNMTRLDAMRYCNWKEHQSPNEKEDAVAASLSTESGVYDLQDDQLVCFHPEAGDHLFDDDEGSPFFWITAEAEEEEYSPLMGSATIRL